MTRGGMNRITGQAMDPNGAAHLVQSIIDILTTPLGSRVLRRTYGSELPDLLDQPLNARTRLRLFAATAQALLRWEPRVRLKKVSLQLGPLGLAALELKAVRTDLPQAPAISFSIPLTS